MMEQLPLYLLDTNWMVDYLAGEDVYLRKFEQLGFENLAISIITKAELYEGIIHSRDPERSQHALEEVLAEGISVLDLNDAMCRIFGQVRGDLRRRGLLIGDLDLLIVSTALHYAIPLCTENRHHFERIGGLEIISIR